MLPLVTEKNRQLLNQLQLANQQITKTIEQIHLQLQQDQCPFYARNNRRQLADALDHGTQQIELLPTPSPCTASTLIFRQLEKRAMQPTTAAASTVATHASKKPREWSLSRAVPAGEQSPRVIGQS